MSDLRCINLWPRETECGACGVFLFSPREGIPMYEGEVLPNDWEGPWAIFDACPKCYEAQGKLTAPVCSSVFRGGVDMKDDKLAEALDVLGRVGAVSCRKPGPLAPQRVWDTTASGIVPAYATTYVRRVAAGPLEGLADLVRQDEGEENP